MTFSINIYSQNINVSSENQTEFENDSSYFNTTNTSNTTSDSNEYKTPSTAGFLIRTILVLVLVLAAIYGIMRFFKFKNNTTKSDDDFLRRVSSLNLAPGKSVEIVSLLDHAYILGVTDSNINLLGEVEDKELVEAMNLNFDRNQNVKKPMNFSDVLEIFMAKKSNGSTNSIYSEAENKINNLDSTDSE